MTFKEFYSSNIQKVKNVRSIEGKNFYVYRITNKVTGMHYYGSRVSCDAPKQDLGIKYYSSSYNKEFILDQRNNKPNYKYKVVRVCKTNVDKQLFESYLHLKFNVKSNSKFYNQVNQTTTGFDCTGHSYNTGRLLSEEHKRKCSEALKGRVVSDETKHKQRVAALNRTEAQNKLRGVKHIGKIVTETTRQLQSINNTGASNPSSKVITIYDNLNNVIHICDGTFKQVCNDNKYPWATLRQAKNGNRLYTSKNGAVSKNILESNVAFIGWYIKIEDKRKSHFEAIKHLVK